MREEEDKRLAQMKKEEEDRLRREIEEKKQKDMEEKRRRLAEVEQKRQAADKASKVLSEIFNMFIFERIHMILSSLQDKATAAGGANFKVAKKEGGGGGGSDKVFNPLHESPNFHKLTVLPFFTSSPTSNPLVTTC